MHNKKNCEIFYFEVILKINSGKNVHPIRIDPLYFTSNWSRVYLNIEMPKVTRVQFSIVKTKFLYINITSNELSLKIDLFKFSGKM